MAISRVVSQSNTNGGAASTSVAFTYPATPTEGNLLVARFSYRVSGTTVTNSPSGWAKAGSTYSNGNINGEIWWKKAGASEPTSHTWTLSASVKSAGLGEEFSSTTGWPANPVGVGTGSSGATGTTGLSTGTTATSGAASGAEILVLGYHACDTNATWSGHSGTNVTITENVEVSSTGGAGSTRNTTSAWSGIAANNSTFAASADLSASNNWAAQIQTFYENSSVVNGNASGTVGTATITSPAATASVSNTASGTVGTSTLTSPAAAATGDAGASGLVGTVTATSPAATFVADASISGLLGTVTVTSPEGMAGISADATGAIGTATISSAESAATGGASTSGTVGTVTTTGVDATATAGAGASGAIGTVTGTAPSASLTVDSTASGAIGTFTITSPAADASGAEWTYDQQLFPDAILSMTNLTGLVTDVDEDVTTPDANWLSVA